MRLHATKFLSFFRCSNRINKSQSREMLAFLPASLEIQEKPPHPLASWTARALIGLFIVAIVWSSVGEIDIVATAEGKIIPSSRVKHIQPLESSVVKSILVKEGDHVEQGQALIELDATLTGADKNRLENELQSVENKLKVYSTLLTLLENDPETVETSSLASVVRLPHDVNQDIYTGLLRQLWREHYSTAQSLISTFEGADAEHSSIKQILLKLERTLPIVSAKADKLKGLYDDGFATEDEHLAAVKEKIQIEQDLLTEKERLKQLDAARRNSSQKIQTFLAQRSFSVLENMEELKKRANSLEEELAKANSINSRKTMYSPVAGQVQQINVSTLGGVVTQAQNVLTIVPSDEQLEVEVQLENKDIGFVKEGMPAEIKIHTFPFTTYGIIDGKITNISDDAIIDENQALIYNMRVVMDRDTLLVGGKEIQLMPGMSVTTEVKTDKRRIIEFFLAPLIKHGKEGLRER